MHFKFFLILNLIIFYFIFLTLLCNKCRSICLTFQMHEHAAKNLAGSRLKITNLDVSDVGFYTCRVTNGKDQIQSEGTLRVDSSKKWQGT